MMNNEQKDHLLPSASLVQNGLLYAANYRAWDDGKMIYQTGALSDLKRFFRVIREDAILMLGSGMYDKNRKQYFLGDIFLGKEQKEMSVPMKEGLYQVCWEDYAFTAKSIDGKNSDCWLFYFETNIRARPLTEGDILGNIFQNAELLQTLPK